MYIKNAANITLSNPTIIYYGKRKDLHIYQTTCDDLSESSTEQFGDPGVTSYFLYINHKQISPNSFTYENSTIVENISISSENVTLL